MLLTAGPFLQAFLKLYENIEPKITENLSWLGIHRWSLAVTGSHTLNLALCLGGLILLYDADSDSVIAPSH